MVPPTGTAKTGVTKWSTGQGVFLPFVKDNLLYYGHVDFDSVNWSRAFMECAQQNDGQSFFDYYGHVDFDSVNWSRAFMECGQATK